MDAVCYGFKLFGQIGSDEFDTVLSQFKSYGLAESTKSIRSIAFGWSRCYIIFEDGSCWKYTLNKEWVKLDNLIPADMKKTNLHIIDLETSDYLHLAVTNEGHLFDFLLHFSAPFPAKVKKASCGYEHYLCLLENGSVFVWGSGSRGQLGNGSLNAVEQPELLVPLDGLIVVDIDAGGWHSAAVTINGDLYTWGWNNFGQLGLHSEEKITDESDDSCITVSSEPQPISYFDDSHVFKQVACGVNHTLVLMGE
ncbi:hypothetical protein V9T40_012489 [Parthenolecanium corni]|uniref:RCC1 domain-containing protein 1 n=1 Tax=Parthenolecanium corni TaxID=536013 RepID=A0AAN9TB76_9HEMI